MKYFLDTEFVEGTQKKWFGKTKPTIDLISIGIVEEDKDAFSKRIGKTNRTYRGREYYAISKDFNLKEAWNRYDIQNVFYDDGIYTTKKVYWIRENVLKPIFDELSYKDYPDSPVTKFSYKSLKYLLKKYGKTNELIAEEVKDFCRVPNEISQPEFYTYYGNYDWVVFCWLFGKMIDLPNGFPMYSKDLKQMLDDEQEKLNNLHLAKSRRKGYSRIEPFNIKKDDNYPKQENEHNALADARWNKKLYQFLMNLK